MGEINEFSAVQPALTLAAMLKVGKTCVHYETMVAAAMPAVLTPAQQELRDKKCAFLQTGRCKIADFTVTSVFPDGSSSSIPSQSQEIVVD